MKLNPGLHRNIKGGEEIKVPSLLVEPGLILKQPNSENEQQTQLNPPPLPPNEETTNRGREAKGGDGVLAADRSPKVVKADDRMLTEMKSEDVSMEGGKVESPANAENDAVQMDPIQDQKKANTFKKASEAILETDSDNEVDARIKRGDSDGDDSDIVAQNDLEEQKANEQQQQQPQTNDEVRREIVSVLEEGEQLSRSPAGRETVFTMKKKNKAAVDSDIIPEDDDDDYVGAISKQQVGEKPSLEPEQGGSPPIGVVAVKKNRDETTVDAQGEGEGREKGGVASDNGAPGGVVKMIRKGELPSRGGGGGREEEEEEKQMTAIEMANAIESGEMVG